MQGLMSEKVKFVSWNVNGLRSICRKYNSLDELLSFFDAGIEARSSIALSVFLVL